ncbi:MAG TPA: GNAT family N-acetyltransferase [Caulobacteraceae bacterium]|jgi:RimJ/RimL family protein N-acetyltransferase|nr:GNAT family N-acetyltransferase [Caulobacteraceae bacterium]
MPSRYVIRRAVEMDLPMLRRWRSLPHVARWWGAASIEPEAAKLKDPRLALWVAQVGARPFAFLQDYLVSEWSPHHFDELPRGSRGMDMYVGEPDLVGCGHGPALLREHVDRLFSEGVPAVGIDPHPENRAACRAFEKAGFTLVGGPVDTRWSRALLMHRRAPARVAIRLATSGDAPALQAILRDTFESTWAPNITAAAVKAAAEEDRPAVYVRQRGRLFRVAEVAGEMAGLVDWEGDFVNALHVRASHARTGVGSRLMDHAEEAIRGAGFGQVRLETDTFNLRSQAFYARRGYQEADRYPDEQWNSGLTTVLLVKSLGASAGTRAADAVSRLGAASGAASRPRVTDRRTVLPEGDAE